MNAAKLYSKFNTFQQQLNVRVINEKLHFLKFQRDENLFEIGCGNGGSTKTLLRYIPNTYNKYIATDKLTQMINQAKQTKCIYHNNVYFEHLDITDKCIKNNWVHSFHKVFSFCSLHWVSKEMQTQAFRNINTLLKTDGCIFISLVADCPVFKTYIKMYQIPRWAAFMEHEQEFISPYNDMEKDRMQNLKAVLRENRLDLQDVEFMNINYTFKSLDELKNTMKAINPFTSRMPAELHDAYWDDFWMTNEMFSDVLKTMDFLSTILFIHAKKINHLDQQLLTNFI